MTSSREPDLHVNIGKIELENPVMTASGTFGYAKEYEQLVDLDRLGGIIVKGLSVEPSKGNPPQRIAETASGMLNAIGLENVGVEQFIQQKLPFLRTLQVPVFANIYGNTIEEYGQVASRIDALEEIAGIEVNISCPNIKAGGITFGVDPEAAAAVVRRVRRATAKTVMVKLSPNVTDITTIAKSVEAAGADSISLINTLTGMAIDIESCQPKLANITGGLSGPAIKPVALRMVWQVAQVVKVPVVGIGGIMTAEDALEFFLAGASAVQVGTANFINPRATMEILTGIKEYLQARGVERLTDYIGSLQIPF